MSTEQMKNAVMFSETSKNAAKGMKTDIYAFGVAFAARINRNAIYSADIIYYWQSLSICETASGGFRQSRLVPTDR